MNGFSTERLHALDLLRFFAAFAVLLYHFTARPGSGFEWLPVVTQFGYLGVPLFFMISGFVIALSANGRTAYQFAVSRVARLYPALWVCILCSVLISAMLAGDRIDPLQILANMTLLNDYLGYADVDVVLWTLHAEIKFYGCVFLLVALGLFNRYRLWMGIWLAMTVLWHTTGQPGFMGWFISPGWSPYFMIGVVAYQIHHHQMDWFNALVLGLSLSLASVHSFHRVGGFIPDASLADASLASLLTLGAAALVLAIATGRLSLRPSPRVALAGAMTYPLYLIHNRAGKAMIDSVLPAVPEWLAVAGATVIVLALSYAINRHVERPVSRWMRRVGNNLPDYLRSAGLLRGRPSIR
ncbi:acyltransferase family protein [Marinobacter sp. SS21]|uniref:acyltransferase family protein n=1 Tax=Marinobacter sp. SS21 TaxID=2979460 RepID=UPI00232F4A9B|nr:acyltransferase [Marinobacter sp. SS21]MDC0664227.1 acyltransferase [Marinobacter sp. SS21]